MLKLCRVTKVKVFFLVLVYVFNIDLFEFSVAILEKGLLQKICNSGYQVIPKSIKGALMASFAMFPTVFKTYEKRCRRFCSKEVSKRQFYSKICY